MMPMSNPFSRYDRMHAPRRSYRSPASAAENRCGRVSGTAYIGNAAS